MSHPTRAQPTYRAECWRAVAAGIIETASATFLLLIAVRWFETGALAKGLIAAGSGLGYLLAPFVVSLVETAGTPVAIASARLAWIGAAALALAAAIPTVPVFVLGSLISLSAAGALVPLLTQIYQDNYPVLARGRFFARTFMIRILSATAFSWLGGMMLNDNIGRFRWMLVVFALAMAASAWFLSTIPSSPLHATGDRHPLRAFKAVRHDRLFRVTLTSWMFMGFANLVMLPLRVEYLANPKYGLALDANRIALLTGVVPNIARLIMTPVWGHFFDRANFFVLRMSLNIGFAIGIVSFFTTNSTWALVLSAITFGISVAGGDVAWSLWVTKIAPPARVADYMGVHTFLTGVRALAAPLLAFAVASRYSMTTMGWISAGAIGIATLMILPDALRGDFGNKTPAPITPPVPADEGEA